MNRRALTIAALAACGYPDPARHVDGGATDGATMIDASQPIDAVDASAPRRPACGSSGTWAEAASLPLPLEYLALVTGSDGRIYAIGGFNDTGTGTKPASSLVLAYTPSTDHWDQVASLPTARGELAAVTAGDGKIYAIGGDDGPSTTLATVEAYAPSTNSWAMLPDGPTRRSAFAAALGPDGRIYTLGGKSTTSAAIATVDAFTPSTGMWQSVPNMFNGRYVLGATTGGDGRIYAVGGYDATLQAATDEVDEYTTSASSWGGLSRLLEPMSYHQVVAVGGKIYSLGGIFATSTASGVGEVYSIASDTWGLGPTIPTPRYAFGAAVGPDGCIYVAGGYGSNNVPLTSVEVYAP